jgi:hypothetical protein
MTTRAQRLALAAGGRNIVFPGAPALTEALAAETPAAQEATRARVIAQLRAEAQRGPRSALWQHAQALYGIKPEEVCR